MASEYQLTATDIVIRNSDGAHIPNDPDNRDRVEYDGWLEAGGVPDPYVPPDPIPPAPDALAEAQRANARLDAGVQAAVEVPPPPEISALPADTVEAPVTQDQFAALVARVDYLEQAVGAMLSAQSAGAIPAEKGRPISRSRPRRA
jgi:hypothetical protein